MRESQDPMLIHQWMNNEDNRKAYREWRNHPITQQLVSMLMKESSPQALPVDANGRVLVELSGYLHGQNIGEHRILRRLMHLDIVASIPEQVIADYNAVEYLVEVEGLSKEDAERIVKEHSDNA